MDESSTEVLEKQNYKQSLDEASAVKTTHMDYLPTSISNVTDNFKEKIKWSCKAVTMQG